MAIRGKTVSAAILVSALLTSLFAIQAVSLASANPINSPLIQLSSPQNNKIYSSGEVQLNFTAVPNSWINFTSAAYSLDGQPAKALNGNTSLTGLASGSHSLTVYGNGAYSYGGQVLEYHSTEAVIYFSIQYSTPWVNFTAFSAAVASIISLIIIWKYKPIVAALKQKKTERFWLGLACFLFFTFSFFVPGIWRAATDYLYPHYSHEIITVIVSPWVAMIVILIFMGIGLFLMWSGTKRSGT